MIGTQEFIDLMNNFEKNAEYLPYGVKFEKEPRESWKSGTIYCDGMTNNYFKTYMLGYSLGRLTYMH